MNGASVSIASGGVKEKTDEKLAVVGLKTNVGRTTFTGDHLKSATRAKVSTAHAGPQTKAKYSHCGERDCINSCHVDTVFSG